MMTSLRRNLLLGAACLGITLPAAAQTSTIFDNSKNDLAIRFDPRTLEVGDQIVFGGTARKLDSFSFEYWAINANGALGGTPSVTVKLYANDGPLSSSGYATPNTVLWQSAPFTITSATERNTLQFSASDFGSNLILPDSVTLSVQFSGWGVNGGAIDRTGVDIFSPPTVGTDYNDYWQKDPTLGWQLMTNSLAPNMNFAMKFDATNVPEPTTIGLSLLGGLGLVLARRMRRS